MNAEPMKAWELLDRLKENPDRYVLAGPNRCPVLKAEARYSGNRPALVLDCDVEPEDDHSDECSALEGQVEDLESTIQKIKDALEREDDPLSRIREILED